MSYVVFLDCGSKYKLEHGSLDFSGQDTTYNKTLQATCEDGYEIRGDNKITCLANGTWSSGPLCRAKGTSHLSEWFCFRFMGHNQLKTCLVSVLNKKQGHVNNH